MRAIILFVVFVFICNSIFAAELTGKNANKLIPGSSFVKTNEKTGFPSYFLFQKGNEIPLVKFSTWINPFLKNPAKTSFKLLNKTSDNLGYIHCRYQQMYDNKPVNLGVFVLHTKDNMIFSFSGNLFVNADITQDAIISSVQAINVAKGEMKAVSYKWEFSSEENILKYQTGNVAATYYPAPKVELYSVSDKEFKVVYVFTLYAKSPIDKKEYVIDAVTGKIIDIRQKLVFADVPGTAITKYSGTQTITTDNSISGSYRLREAVRGIGNGVETYNMSTGTDYGSAIDFTDTDNNWNNVNAQQDEVATDAHWGAEKTYDYFYLKHGRNSIDNNGFKLISYVHFDADYSNAFWDGQSMTYGDGNGSYTPFTALDICGHEITHGLDEFTAGLIYQDESGALNEGFSDIFGTAIEFYAKPSLANWTMGEDIGNILRSMANPNDYGDPDTYNGTNWYTGTADYGGVHTNCTVLGHWFYLVSQGGSGTNDIGSNYTISGIGLTSAEAVAFRTLTVYLGPSSTYEDARFYAITSAIDLFGACTPEVEAVTNAMYAVGLGTPYVATVIADFSSSLTTACSAPFTVTFQNLSNNSSSFLWNFGDGNTSTLASPTHTYNSLGTYNVSLIADGGACGKDTMIKNSFISVSEANPCVIVMPLSGTGDIQTSCIGTLFDGGGPTGNYIDQSDAVITISPTGATDVTLTFISFDVEPGSGSTCDYDYVELFDGANTSATSLGRFCNTNGSPGTVTSSGGSITILLHSDQALNLAGFEADWSCSMSNIPPVANFVSSPATTCTGDVSFTDNSTNGPTSWLWDFGDGNTSTDQNPSHNYNTNGIYDVTLTATNAFGSDTYTLLDVINVIRPAGPVVEGDTVCPNEQAILNATGSGIFNWFSAPVGGTLLFTGSSFTTPALLSTVMYYVENLVVNASQYVGPTNNTSNGGTNTNSSYLIFDCFTPVTLVSVSVNANAAGNRLISLQNSAGTTIQSATINIPAGVSRITLNFDIPVGTSLRLVGPANCGLYRINTTSGATITYPYTIPGVVSITSSNVGAGSYYYFFDWEIKEPDCNSLREPVVVFVDECLNIQEINSNHFQVYPNPVYDNVFVKFISPERVNSLFVIDVLGKKIDVKIEKISDDISKVNLTNITSGIYFISVLTNNGLMKCKIIKN